MANEENLAECKDCYTLCDQNLEEEKLNKEGVCECCAYERDLILSRFDDLVRFWPNYTRDEKFKAIEGLWRL